MVALRPGALVIAILLAAATASAAPDQAPAPAPQPAPAGPVDPYLVPAGQDPVLAEQIAEQLVTRAQELLDAKIYVDAKQLAVEALVKSPKGPAAERAKLVIKQINQVLGITELPPPEQTLQPDLTPIEDPTTKPGPEVPETPSHDGEPSSPFIAATTHGAIYLGLVGTTIGAFFDRGTPAAGAIPTGIALGAVGGLVAPWLVRRYHIDEAQVRTVGAGTVWGGTIGGMFAATVIGSNGGHVHAPGVLVGASIGSTLGGLGAASLASDHRFTEGDVALVDTFAGIGTFGGLTLGMLMQPAQREAYALNSVLGAASGVIVGYIAAPQTNTTQRRMLRVAGLSALAGAVPFLLYAGIHDPHSTGDERAVGALSTAGLVGGAWLGFYLTRDMDVGLDVQEGKSAPKDDAPPAVVGRTSGGRWSVGTPAIGPLSPVLSPERGMALTLLGGAF